MIMTSDDREGCRSLVCDSNGIIIAEMVYRCMICAFISDSICDAQRHYQVRHMDSENQPSTSVKQEPIDFLEEDDSDGNDANFSEEDLISDPNDNFHDSSAGFQDYEPELDPDLRTKSIRRNFTSYHQQQPTAAAFASLINEKNTLAPAYTGSSRGGFVTCAVCHITKFYASVQRRYGQFTCMGCAKFFGRFLLKPRKYCCPNLGNCPLDATPRCKACLLQACIETYSIDEKRMKIVNMHRPVRKSSINSRQPNSGNESTGASASSPPLNAVNTMGMPMNNNSSMPAIPTSSSPNVSVGSINNFNNNSNTSQPQHPHQLQSAHLLKQQHQAAAAAAAAAVQHAHQQRSSILGQQLTSNTAGSDASTSISSRSRSSNTAVLALLRSSGKKNWGCRKCAGCLVEDCGKCNYCLDKPKFGGANTLKKKCIQRKCLLQEQQKLEQAQNSLRNALK